MRRVANALEEVLAEAGAAADLTAARLRVLLGAAGAASLELAADLAPPLEPYAGPAALAALPVAELAELLAQADLVDGRPVVGRAGRRASGAYYTPPWLVQQVLDRALDGGPRGPLLDPACGAGAFLLAALRRGVPPELLHGADRDPVAVLAARIGLCRAGLRPAAAVAAVRPTDGLIAALPCDGEATAVVGNPPWGMALTAAERAALVALLGPDLGPRRGEPDSAVLFLLRSHQRLAPGGRLAMILPESWLSSLRAEPLRRWLLAGRLRELEVYRKGVFRGAPDLVPTVVVTGAPARGPIHVRRFGLTTPVAALGAGWEAEFEVPPADWLAEPRAVFAVGVDPALAGLWHRLAAWPRLAEHATIGDGVYRTRLAALLDGGPRPALMGAASVIRFRVVPGPHGLSAAATARLPRPQQARQLAPKILCHALRKPALPDRIVAAVDLDGCVAANNLVLIQPRPGSPWPPHALCAWLNGRLANRWFADRYVQVNIEAFALGSVPLPHAAAETVAELEALGRRAAAGEPSDAMIERIVDRLAGVTPLERAAIDRRWSAGDAAAPGQSRRIG